MKTMKKKSTISKTTDHRPLTTGRKTSLVVRSLLSCCPSLNLRVLFGLFVMLAGVLLALVSFGTFSSVFAQTTKTNPIQQAVQPASAAPGTDVMSADPNLNALLAAHPPRVVYGNPAEGPSGLLQGPQAPTPNEAWGSQQGATWIAATQFVRRAEGPGLAVLSGTPYYFFSPGSPAPLPYVAQLTVEPGHRINRITCAYLDFSAGHDVTFFWYKFTTNVSTGATNAQLLDVFATSGAPGYGYDFLLPPAGEETMHVYDGALSVINHYIEAYIADDTAFAGCWVFHQRQVAPGPASATFSDVPTSSPWFPYVEALVDTNVTGGCAPGLYCPNDPVTRGQMATFLARALGMGFPY
jgi:hypothetical protein